MNALMPASVTAGTAVTVALAFRIGRPGISPAEAATYTFLVTMLALAVLEHWMLVLPLPFERLWSWVLTLRQPRRRIAAPVPVRPWDYLSGSSK